MRYLAILLSLVLSLGLCEGVARLLEGTLIAPTPDQYKFYRFDPVLGWSNTPNVTGIFNRVEYSTPVRINRHGMRYREVTRARSPDVARAVILGDSFTWGMGVAEEDRFTEQVEREFGGRIELLNFGVTGYSPVQYSLMLDEVMSFNPDLIVVVFCLGNDFVDNVMWQRYGYYKPYAELDGAEGVRLSGYPLPDVKAFGGIPNGGEVVARWLDQYSALYRRVELLPWRAKAAELPSIAQRGLTALDSRQRDFYVDPTGLSDEKQAAVSAAIEINRRLLLAMSRRAQVDRVRFLILPAITKCEFGRCFGDLRETNLRVLKDLTDTANSLNLPIVNTNVTLTLADFWEEDYHWRPSGHRKIAEALTLWLRTNQLVGH